MQALLAGVGAARCAGQHRHAGRQLGLTGDALVLIDNAFVHTGSAFVHTSNAFRPTNNAFVLTSDALVILCVPGPWRILEAQQA